MIQPAGAAFAATPAGPRRRRARPVRGARRAAARHRRRADERGAVHAELSEVVAGTRPGRTTAEEVTIFDSTGTALQDLAAAIAVEERARAAGAGWTIDLGG